MADPVLRPVLRHLEVHPFEDGQRRGLVLVDPLDLVPDPVFVPEGLLPIVGRFDGVRTVEDVRRELAQDLGEAVPLALVTDLVDDLDRRLLLLSPRFRAALRAKAVEFADRAIRPCRHAGSAGYPATAEPLREALHSMVRLTQPQRPTPRGLVAPHIDLARGREGYAQAYGYLAESEPCDLYVVFGTGHQGPGAAVTGLRADWETPLGTVPTDRDFVDRVHARLGPADPLDVLLHRQEHSLEFQVLFLSHLLAGHEFRVAGFLTGTLPGTRTDDPAMADLLDAFRSAATESEARICYVAGADLAHLGPHFGDPRPIDDARLSQLAATERQRLAHLEQGDPDAFRQAIEADGNRDRVCGVTPIVLTAALAGGIGEMLHYGQAVAPDRSQVVSFCSMAFDGR